MLNKYKAKIKEFFLRFRKYLPIIIILLALPVTIVAGRQIQDLRNFAANETQVLGFVQVNPGSLSTKVGDSDTQMSALAYDPAGRPIWADVTYEWSMSSINSVGTLGATSGKRSHSVHLAGSGMLCCHASRFKNSFERNSNIWTLRDLCISFSR